MLAQHLIAIAFRWGLLAGWIAGNCSLAGFLASVIFYNKFLHPMIFRGGVVFYSWRAALSAAAAEV